MNKHLFSHLTWKLALGNRWRPGATLIALVLALFLVGCTNANIKPEGESFPGESNQPQTPASGLMFAFVHPTRNKAKH